MQGIIMRGKYGQLWIAYIDGDVVRYFTTERAWYGKLPTTIEKWRESFKDKQIILDSKIDPIP
jgi:hypothetical protein